MCGFLDIGQMLLRGSKPHGCDEKLLSTSFSALNFGLVGMAIMTLLPMGIIQFVSAIEHGYRYASSGDLMQPPLIQMLVRMRAPRSSVSAR